MKILYIPAKQKLDINLSEKEISKLPRKLFLAYSLQYKDLALKIKKQLEDSKIKIIKIQQVLGCSKVKTNIPILLISTGRFHAENLFEQAPAVYILESDKITKIPDSEIQKIKTRKRTALIKFLKADKLGILVSTKPGQESLDKALRLRDKLKKQNKQAYLFLSNNIDINQFENFFLDSWVNTACLGLESDNNSIINIQDIK